MWFTLAAFVTAAAFPASPYWSVALSLPFLYVALLTHRARASHSPSFLVFLGSAVPLLLQWQLRNAFRLGRKAEDDRDRPGAGSPVVVQSKNIVSTKTAMAYVFLIRNTKDDSVKSTSATEDGSLNNVSYPPCLLETIMFQPALELLMTCPQLHVSPTSLIHVGQKCHVYDPRIEGKSWAESLLDLTLSSEVRVGSIEAVPKGTMVTILFDVHRDGHLIWSGETRLLSPDAEAIKKLKERKKQNPSHSHVVCEAGEPGTVTKQWSLPSSTLGYSYGRAAHDFNLVHLPLLCHLVGFRRPILQGMMSLARAVAEMETAFPDCCRRYPLEVECEWKVPLILPGEATIELRPSGTFQVLDGRKRPHCVGRVGQSSTMQKR